MFEQRKCPTDQLINKKTVKFNQFVVERTLYFAMLSRIMQIQNSGRSRILFWPQIYSSSYIHNGFCWNAWWYTMINSITIPNLVQNVGGPNPKMVHITFLCLSGLSHEQLIFFGVISTQKSEFLFIKFVHIDNFYRN